MKPLNPCEPSVTVVVVNDDVIQINLLTALLNKEGIAVLPFLDAEAALKAMVQNRPPDLIITDLYMAGLDGWRFCRLLRSPEYQAFNQTPILVVSATFSGEEAARITADLGADAFLTSPIDAGRFIEHVHTLLGGERSQHQLRVLIVEDSKTLTGILKRAFDAHGYRTETVLTATEAAAAFRKSGWDVAVIDY
jgi:DNA-binding response OmpR family regulator